MISLGGLPPLLGFIAKLRAVQLIVINLRAPLAVVLILSSLISLFYYLRVIYFLILRTRKINLIFTQQKQSIPIFTLVICLGGNLAAPLIALLA
jgi:NADH-quinone oxidoreductase subunit N